MKKQQSAVFLFLGIVLILMLLLAACSGTTTVPPATTTAPAAPTAQAAVTSSVPKPTSAPALSTPAQSSVASPARTTTPTPTPAASGVTPQSGGVLNIIATSLPNTLGPPSTMPAPTALFDFPALEPLIGLSKDGPVPTKLATSWDIGADGKSLTLHLRQGVKFHDGTDFNAAAVKYNLDREIGVRAEVSTLTSVDVVDNSTVKLNLTSYSNTLIYQLGNVSGLMESPAAYQAHDNTWFSNHMVGTGPFEFVSFDSTAGSLVYKKFNNYWDPGKPYLDGLRYTFIVDSMTAEAYFRSGGAQLWDQLLPVNLKSTANLGLMTNSIPRTVWVAIGDSANPSSPFAKQQVRQALDYAIDKKAVVNTFGYGTWEAPIEPISSIQFGYIPNFQGRSYDPAKAKQLLSDAGYPNGFKTTMYVRNNLDINVFVAYQAYLKAVGIDVQIQPVDIGTYSALQTRGWNGIFVTGLGIAGSYARMLQTDGPNPKADVSANLTPQYAAAMAAATAAQDKASELKANQQLVQTVFDEAVMVAWNIDSTTCIYDKSVHVDMDTISLQFWNPGNSWLGK